jgi:hypothetical protein
VQVDEFHLMRELYGFEGNAKLTRQRMGVEKMRIDN